MIDDGSLKLLGPTTTSTGLATGGRGKARGSLRAALVDERLVRAAIVLLASVLRFAGIGARIQSDDAYSYLVASPGSHHFLTQLAATENTPPVFYLLLAPLPLEHEAWLRIPAAVPGVLMCLILFCSLLTLVPWIPEMVRARHQVGITKLAPSFPAPSLTALRDVTDTLALGEYGGTTNAVGRWLELAGVAVLALGAATVL